MIDENANTADLTINEKLDRILAELSDMSEDAKDVVMRLDRIESRLEELAIDVVDVRETQRRPSERMDEADGSSGEIDRR
jgi:predicted  nucleic acid-binding Zn-ribbon protein